MPLQTPEIDALLTLNLTPGFGPVLTSRALDLLGSAQAVLSASPASLEQIPGVGREKSTALRRALDAHGDGKILAREKECMAQFDAHALFKGQPDYPRLLAMIPDPPPVLYVRGKLVEQDSIALGVVGSRKCTAYGREQADRLSAWCAQAGLTIVSGGAYGIDTAAHRAALRVKGRTVIVLGSGLARPYPDENVELFEQAVRQSSAVVSEHPMLTSPRAEFFPRRNRIISGLSLGVLVIEAALRSGALITARLAVDDHNREVMALPGRVDSHASAGCHKILRENWAKLITSGPDILECLSETGVMLQRTLPASLAETEPASASAGAKPAAAGTLFEQNLSDSQRQILEALDQPREVDELAARTSLPVAKLQADLTMLQLRSLIARQGSRIARVPHRN
jgi:DNA processing protein